MARFARNIFHLLCAALLLTAGAADGATKRPPTRKPAPPSAPVKKPAPQPEAAPEEILARVGDGELPIVGKGAIVIDGCTGAALYEKNADAPQFPASTTKIMTALLVIEEGDLDRIVDVTDDDAKVGESSLSIKAGEQYTRRQMLFGLLLKSANDVAHALGRDNAGTIEAFAEKMTTRAQELGATHTSFRNPHGLHDPEHFTTPRDLATIARAAMQQPYFREIVGTMYYTWQRPVGRDELHNHNRLLWLFPGCTGVKTGYTNPAQQVLVSSAMKGAREVISVVMHSAKPGILEDSKLLLTYGLKFPPGTHPEKVSPGPKED